MADKSKLSIAYTLYANNLKCDEFLTRLVRHLAPQIEVLQPEEFVALLLVIYLNKSWSPEGKSYIAMPSLLVETSCVPFKEFYIVLLITKYLNLVK